MKIHSIENKRHSARRSLHKELRAAIEESKSERKLESTSKLLVRVKKWKANAKVGNVNDLMESSHNLAVASSVLPIVSTLTFGFAITALIEVIKSDWSASPQVTFTVVICLSGSVSLSIFTTTFALLEVYYIEMSTGARSWVQFNEDVSVSDPARFSEERTPAQSSRRLDDASIEGKENEPTAFCKRTTSFKGNDGNPLSLAIELDALIGKFTMLRRMARNAMWASLILIIAAIIILFLGEYPSLLGLVVASILLAGILSILYTVISFRSAYQPLHDKYTGHVR